MKSFSLTVVEPQKSFLTRLIAQRALLAMSLPWVALIVIFAYVPLYGWIIAFQDFRPSRGFLDQTWVGLKWFEMLFSRPDFWLSIRNTLVQSTLNLFFGFSSAIGLALLLTEIKVKLYKRIIQTLSYLPYFISWVVAANIVMFMLSLDGPLNQLLMGLNVISEPILFMGEGRAFWPIIAISNVWKNVGWNAIIYLAAIATINPELYEAAEIDGANRFQKIRHITLPSIRPTFILLLVINIGYLLSAGFDQAYLLMNPLNREFAVNLDIYVFEEGLRSTGIRTNFSYGTAAGIFKSIVSLGLVFGSNAILKRNGGKGLF